MRSFFIWLANQLFPPQCLGCDVYGKEVCDACLRTIKVSPKWVERDGLPILTLYSFENSLVEKIIHAWKYNRRKDLVLLLLRLIDINLFPKGVYIAVPMHKKRVLERGENHLDRLVEYLSNQRGVEAMVALKRIKHTKQQALLNKEERQENMKDAFAVIKKVTATRCILIDDVVSTGGTLLSCKDALEKEYSGEIIAICLARNEKEKTA